MKLSSRKPRSGCPGSMLVIPIIRKRNNGFRAPAFGRPRNDSESCNSTSIPALARDLLGALDECWRIILGDERLQIGARHRLEVKIEPGDIGEELAVLDHGHESHAQLLDSLSRHTRWAHERAPHH